MLRPLQPGDGDHRCQPKLSPSGTILWLLLAAAVLAGSLTLANPAAAHQGNPDFRSIPDRIVPAGLGEGIEVEVVNFDDHVVLVNRSGRDVEILGYEREPYARVLADGAVEVNLNSPSHYLNEDRYANVPLPARADTDAPPDWELLGTDGRFEWHDHRSHYMSEGTPPQVKDESVRTKIFDYTIPLRVDGRPARIEGTLFWQGRDDGFPVLPFVLLGLVALVGGSGLWWRRHRSQPGADDESRDGRQSGEAW